MYDGKHKRSPSVDSGIVLSPPHVTSGKFRSLLIKKLLENYPYKFQKNTEQKSVLIFLSFYFILLAYIGMFVLV